MQEVSLRRCAKLTDEGLAELALGGTLRSLCVAGVPRMGSAALQALAAACRRAALSTRAPAHACLRRPISRVETLHSASSRSLLFALPEETHWSQASARPR